MLLNLIINARQAMPRGGTVKVRVAHEPNARLAEVSVADTGDGIAPADLRRIFEPFFTTKTGPDDVGLGGTGLGLSVCRDIVESHRGRLRAESRRRPGDHLHPPPPRLRRPRPARRPRDLAGGVDRIHHPHLENRRRLATFGLPRILDAG